MAGAGLGKDGLGKAGGYKAIVDAGFILQIDDPARADHWDMGDSEPLLEEDTHCTMVRVEALNQTLQGLPADRIRSHVCWGSWHGPHATDIPLKDCADVGISCPPFAKGGTARTARERPSRNQSAERY
jgi:5-methyltetrahydropteroyltriglutamate--homocysteine methyltransferase